MLDHIQHTKHHAQCYYIMLYIIQMSKAMWLSETWILFAVTFVPASNVQDVSYCTRCLLYYITYQLADKCYHIRGYSNFEGYIFILAHTQ